MGENKTCNCLNIVTEKTTARIKKVFDKDKKEISRYGDGTITTVAIMFGGPMSRRLYFPYELEYWPIKKDGSEGQRRVEKTNIMFSFCPFCGKKYPEDKGD